ncbi:hypothetical protein XM57_19230 [Burkholderia cepacia]|jgi:hypothetical protein|nr:hypothetical protein XM57_19230 [Burkholderia cepacia]
MRRCTDIKVACIGAVILLLIEALATGGWYLLSRPAQGRRELVVTKALRDDLYLYVVRDDSGGATIPFRFKYYFWNRHVDRDEVDAVVDRQAPFLTASSEAAQVSARGDDVAVAFRGRVYDFSNLAVFYIGDSPRFVPLHLDAQPDFVRP